MEITVTRARGSTTVVIQFFLPWENTQFVREVVVNINFMIQTRTMVIRRCTIVLQSYYSATCSIPKSLSLFRVYGANSLFNHVSQSRTFHSEHDSRNNP